MNDATLKITGRIICGLCNMIVGHFLCKGAIIFFSGAGMMAHGLIDRPHLMTGDWELVSTLIFMGILMSTALYYFVKLVNSPSPDVSIVSDRGNTNEKRHGMPDGKQ